MRAAGTLRAHRFNHRFNRIGRDAALDEQYGNLVDGDEIDRLLDIANAGFVFGAQALNRLHLPAECGAEILKGVVRGHQIALLFFHERKPASAQS